MKVLMILIFLLLYVPALVAQIADPPTWDDFAATSCSGTCQATVTVPATTSGIAVLLVQLHSSSNSNTNEVVCSLGGESLDFVERSSNAATQMRAYEGLQSLLTTVGAGSKTIQCDNAAGANNLQSMAGWIIWLEGAAQETAEAKSGTASSGDVTSRSVSLTVSDGALLLYGQAHGTSDPGTVDYGANTAITPEVDNVNSRYAEAAYRFVATASNPEVIGLSWANAVVSHGVGVSYAPAPPAEEDDVKPPVLTVIQPFPFVPPPPETLTITNDTPLSPATEGQAYSANFPTTGGTDPKSFRVSDGGEDDAR